MVNPLTDLIDGILDRAAAEGRFDALPSVRELLFDFGDSERNVTDRVPARDRMRASMSVLHEEIGRTSEDLARTANEEVRSAMQVRLSDLRLRLATEIAALRLMDDAGPAAER